MNHVPLNILIVDDEDDIAVGISRSLSKLEGVNEVVCSPSAEQALEKMRKQAYHIVVSDILLAGMDDLELLSSIKQNHPGTRVVIMTAFSSINIQLEVKRLGSDSYLEKPFDLRELKDIVIRLADTIR